MAYQEEWRAKVKALLLLLLRGYKRFLSPFLPRACRFEPTCSVYMMEAIDLHGPLHGLWLGLRRLGRCQPFFEGGFDPVPGSSEQASSEGSSAVIEGSHRSCCDPGSAPTPLTSVSSAPTMTQSKTHVNPAAVVEQ